MPVDAEGYPIYRLKWEGPNRREELCRVDWYRETESTAGLPLEVVDELRKSQPALITATLRDGISKQRGLIEGMLRMRPPGAETIVMPCENSVPSDWQAIRALCEELGASYLQPLVNRIALPLAERGPESRTTRAHELGELLVCTPANGSSILAALAVNDEFGLVEELGIRIQRKLFMVNGAHLALGIKGACWTRPVCAMRRSHRTASTTSQPFTSR